MTDTKKTLIRKCILLALLFAVLAFLYIQRDYLREPDMVYLLQEGREYSTEAIPVTGTHVIEQAVVTESDMVGSVGIMFRRPGEGDASGRIEVALIDPDGKTVADTGLDASFVKSGDETIFMLGGESEAFNANRIAESYGQKIRTNIKVERGKTYTVRISFYDVVCDGPLELELCSYSEKESGDPADVVADGKTLDGKFADLYVINRMYERRVIMLLTLMFLSAFVFVLIPFEKIDGRLENKDGKEDRSVSVWISRMLFAAAPLAAYFILQRFSGFTIKQFLQQLLSGKGTGMLNLLIIGLIWWLLYTVSNRVRFAAAATVLLASVLGFINFSLLQFRDSPLVATDIAQLDTALQVADSYTVVYDKISLLTIALTVIWCVVVYSLPYHRGLSLKKRIIPLIVLVIWSGACYHVFISSSFIEDHGFRVSSFRPRGSYNNNGSALSFVISLRNSIVRKPEGYDAENVKRIAENYQSDAVLRADEVSEETPNVIIIMNESFSDLSVLGEFGTNEDYMPFYRSLKDKTINGWMDSSVLGGSTANSEFECLTGFTTKFLPYQSVPYRSVIKNETPSLAKSIGSMDYGGIIAFHPGMKDSYNRDVVYPLLGFEKHIAYEDLNDPEKIRDFVSDRYDYKYLEQQYEDFRKTDPDSPFYMFNVTIQNHGGYSLDTGKVDAGISITSEENQSESAQQYLNLMKYSDEALKELINYFSNNDEETVILLFGDHQPRVEDGFYESLRAQHPEISEIEWSELKHRVPFMIWANYDLGGSKDRDVLISANYLAPYLKQITGLPLTGFDKYLLDMKKELPVINAICCIDADGNIYDPDEESKYDSRLNEYAQIQYNGLIDTKNRIEDFFRLKQ